MQFSKIGLILARKWKRMNQESTTPFWGLFREVFGGRLKIWALEVSFFGTQKQALLAIPFAMTQLGRIANFGIPPP